MALRSLVLFAAIAAVGSSAWAQSPDEPFEAGTPLELSSNAKTYGGFRFAESITYDANRDLYVVSNGGIAEEIIPNDGYVSLMNPDGTAHTLKWIGVNRNGLELNHPLGSFIQGSRLYLADIDTIRWFDLETGKPLGNTVVAGASRFNDLEVADDGTIFATQTGDQDPDSWRVYRISATGEASIIVQGAPLAQPNGIAFDNDGNLVVVNIGSKDILTFSRSGELRSTQQSYDAGNDGIAVMTDGTMYVSSVRQGTVARIRPGQDAERIAYGIPSAASMTYDSKRNRLVIPMNNWNAVTFVELD